MSQEFIIQNESIPLETLFESMPVALVLLDREGRHIALNQKLASFSGLNARDLVGRKVAELSDESGENIKRDFAFFDDGKPVPDHEVTIANRVYFVSVRPLRDKTGFAIGEMVALTDITEKKKMERDLSDANERLRFLASHDALTGVLNTRAYYEVCDRLMCVALRDKKNFSVLFVDLDHFKGVNDTYGHDAGDAVLKATATQLQKSCRKCDVIGRVGGEEFSVFLPETDHVGAMTLAEKIRSGLENLLPPVHGKGLRITASIGVASNQDHHKAIADILRDADHAMYHAKSAGRNRVSSLDLPCYVDSAQSGSRADADSAAKN